MDEGQQQFLEATLPHLDVVYRVARHAIGDHHHAEDLVQETYLRAFAHFDQHQGESTRAWLVTICLNLARSEGRRRARRVVEAPFAVAEETEDRGAAVAEKALAGIERESVARALAALPEEQRIAIVLMDLAGHTAAEVAELVGSPRNTVLSRVHRGRRSLAQLLSKEDLDHDLR